MPEQTIPLEQLTQPIASPRSPEPAESKPSKPVGWWSLENLQGAREAVIRAIENNKGVPSGWRLAICDEIRALPEEFNFIYLDAHFHIEKGNSSLHLTIQPDKALV